MNVIKLSDEQRRAIHSAICSGNGVSGAARAARIDRRTLTRLVEGGEGDAFLLSLVPSEEITRDDWRGLESECHAGERMTAADLRARYLGLLEGRYGDSIRQRVRTEEERRQEIERRAEAERKAEEERRKKRREREYERRLELEEERTEAASRVYGQEYRDVPSIFHAFAVLFGTDEEYRAGLGGFAHTHEREEWRKANTVKLGPSWFDPDKWRAVRGRMERTARERVQAVAKLCADHAADLRAAGFSV